MNIVSYNPGHDGAVAHLSGGCGLNCDWNTNWRETGHFSDLFVPPVPNDSGSAIGTVTNAVWLRATALSYSLHEASDASLGAIRHFAKSEA